MSDLNELAKVRRTNLNIINQIYVMSWWLLSHFLCLLDKWHTNATVIMCIK